MKLRKNDESGRWPTKWRCKIKNSVIFCLFLNFAFATVSPLCWCLRLYLHVFLHLTLIGMGNDFANTRVIRKHCGIFAMIINTYVHSMFKVQCPSKEQSLQFLCTKLNIVFAHSLTKNMGHWMCFEIITFVMINLTRLDKYYPTPR